RKVADVLEDDRVVGQRIARAVQTPTVAKASVGHRLDHHVDVVAVIEVPVADHDRVELGEVDLPLRVLHDRARPRVEADARVAFFDVEAAGSSQLLRDHEPRTGSPHECQLQVCLRPRLPGRSGAAGVGGFNSATSLNEGTVLSPKYLSYSSATRSTVSIS